MDLNKTPFIGLIDSSKNLKEGRLTGTIAPDDSKELSLLDLEADVVECPARFPLIPQV
jgi:hypothetical protein